MEVLIFALPLQLLTFLMLLGKSFSSCFDHFQVFVVFWSLFVYWVLVLDVDVAKEVISCWMLCNPKCVVFSYHPLELYPTAPFPVKGNWVKPLGG